jgi:hypothetical protein
MRPVEPDPPKRIVPPDGMRSLDGEHAPPGASVWRAPASRLPPCAAAQNEGPCREDPDTTRCRDPRGETFLGGAAPATPEGLTPPSSERSDELSLVDRRRVVFELPTTRRTLTRDFVPGGSPILSIAFPREHELQSPLSRRTSVALG